MITSDPDEDFTPSTPASSINPIDPDLIDSDADRSTDHANSQRTPWLGLLDLALFWLLPFVAAIFVGTVVLVATGDLKFNEDGSVGDISYSPLFIIFGVAFPLVIGAIGVLSAQKFAIGPERDWRIKVESVDIAWGLLIAIICILSATGVAGTIAYLLDFEDESTNTAILTEPEGIGVILALASALLVAPICEEVIFRGMLLRVFQRIGNHAAGKWAGFIAAAFFPTAIFAVLHAADSGGWEATAVLVGAIFSVGLVLAAAALYFKRLGPGIIGHFAFNAFAAVGTLLTVDDVEPPNEAALGFLYQISSIFNFG